jgi:hypothetical protein
MDKEDLIELQKLDCNCNDCAYMQRDFERFKKFDKLYEGREKCSYRIHYGHCVKFNKSVSFTPMQCQLHTQECFRHRREYKLELIEVKEIKKGK